LLVQHLYVYVLLHGFCFKIKNVSAIQIKEAKLTHPV
jgi:hypothetical protein